MYPCNVYIISMYYLCMYACMYLCMHVCMCICIKRIDGGREREVHSYAHMHTESNVDAINNRVFGYQQCKRVQCSGGLGHPELNPKQLRARLRKPKTCSPVEAACARPVRASPATRLGSPQCTGMAHQQEI